jgi:hypothetical protein
MTDEAEDLAARDLRVLIAETLAVEAIGYLAMLDAPEWAEHLVDLWRSGDVNRLQMLEELVVIGERAAQALRAFGR